MNCSVDAKKGFRLGKGFSLIEVLTTVVIIAVLAGLLFPVVSAAKRSSMGTYCLANLRNAGRAFEMYASDHDTTLPQHNLAAELFQYAYSDQIVNRAYCRCLTRFVEEPYCWLDDIRPYLRLSIMACPGDDRPIPELLTASYEYKLDLAYDGNLSRLSKPSKVAMLWEQKAFHQPGKEGSYDERATLNVLFVDGHAKYKKLSRTTTAVFGDGPDLTIIFPGVGESREYEGEDFID